MQGYERLSGEYVRRSGLTHAQFDIIATLGNTPGMSYKELGDKTLITKGTLTGVIERLEQKGLVERQRSDCDKRSFFVKLTKEGERTFCTVFPEVISQSGKVFADFTEDDYTRLEKTLSELKTVIMSGQTGNPSTQDCD
ncbi:DNA-binding transcriptional regulator, MarR family [Duganella sacchari]|uniref:DNA-binding transcriptional regulator, MarR family n=2 Tax=Telluria group TaxID=2895353 RepID=A0A1M7Q044_9BURK|nr:DNA-binding transcriptional regulator, MarR family [Duganella sacchari]